ncbi:MAG: hypothetical protein OXP69_17795 [Spirochaetaceae bacterium]|nr:hypothetical protein [Spirochaetaceae bacterium]
MTWTNGRPALEHWSVMSDTPTELAACSAYLKQAAQIAPQSVATAVSIVLLSCARECARHGGQPPADSAGQSLLDSIHDRARNECRVAPSAAPMVDRLLHYFHAFGEHHLRRQP